MTLLDTTPDTNVDSASGAPTSAAARRGGTVATPGLRIERLGPAFGAIVHGVDLAQVDDAIAFDLRRALLAHKVLFFRGQDAFDDDAQVRLGNLLGELTAGHPVAGTHERKEIYSIDSSDPEFSFSDEWPTDVTFMKEPPAISVLRAVTLPDYGGDTPSCVCTPRRAVAGCSSTPVSPPTSSACRRPSRGRSSTCCTRT